MSRTEGGLVLLNPSGNGHPSASQRREEMLQLQLAQTQAAVQHYLTIIAVLVIQQGGKAVVPSASIRESYDLGFGKIAETGDLLYTAKLNEPRPLVATPLEPPPS